MKLREAIAIQLANPDPGKSYSLFLPEADRIISLVERFLHHNISDYISPRHLSDKLNEDHLP